MKLRALFPAVAFLSLLMLFSVAAAPFLSFSPVSPVHAQSGAPVFPEAGANEDYTRNVDENTKPYDADKNYVMIGDPITATGSGIIYSIENARTSHFGINSYTGHLLVGYPLDYETKSTYTVTVIAKNTSSIARQEVTINVNNLDEPGKVTLKWRPSGDNVEFEAMLIDGDQISGTTTWQWSGSASQNSGYTDIGNATSATFTNTTSHKYLRATASYTDTHASNKTVSATLKVEQSGYLEGYALEFDVNTSGGYVCPHRNTNDNYDNADADICVSVPRNVTPGDDIYYPASLKYTHDSDDSEDDRYPSRGTISYSLGGADAGKFDIDPVSGDLLPEGSHQYNSPGPDGVFLVVITATDASGRNASVSIALQPSGSDNNPVVRGPRVIRYPENGTWQVAKYTGKVHDEDKEDVDVGWIIGVQPGGGDGDVFEIDDDGVLYFDQPPDYEQGQREYSFSLHVYDTNPPGRGRPGQTFYSVKVIVEDVNDPPEIVGPTDVDFPENSTYAVAEYTVEGVDAGETANWKPLSGTGASEFSLTSTRDDPAELRFNSPPDYESFDTGNDEHIFLLTIMVEVGGEMKTEHVRVEVTNVNEPPSFATETTTRNVGENAGPKEDFGSPVEATDPDESDYLNYTLTGRDDDSSFDIDYSYGQLRTIPGVDYGTKSSYTVTVTATDQGGLTDTITITTNEENDAPVFSGGSSTATKEVAENSPADTNVGDPISATDEDQDTLTYLLEGTQQEQDDFNDAFQLNTSTGQITVKANDSLNFEDKASYTFDIGVSDNNGGTATIDVTIDVTDVNEVPTFDDGASTTRTVIENTAAGENIGAPVSATDPDNENNPNTQTLTYTLGGDDASSFDIDASSGQLRTKDALDHDTKATYTVTVSVRDSKDDSGNADSAEDDTIAVTITVTGENEPPEFAAETDTRTIPENTAAGQNIGAPYTATDPDNGDTLTYTLEGTDAGSFEIVSNNGQIKTKAGVIYDYEAAKNSYEVTVKADDYNGGTDTIDVTIDITNVDEAGTVTFNPTPPKAGTLLTATLTDLDGNVSGDTWEWLAADSATGTLTAITDATSNTYTPTVDDVGKFLKAKASYTDDEGSGKNAAATTTVGVTPANTPHTFPDGDSDNVPDPVTLSIAENSAANTSVGTVSTTDSDATDILIYSLEGETAEQIAFNEAFLFDTSTSEITVKADDSLDHETTPSYTFDVGVSDGKDAAGYSDTFVDSTVAVTINVTDVNEPPAFATETDTRTVPENTAAGEHIGVPFTATDPDDGDTLTYVLSGTDHASFTIETVNGGGQLKTKSPLDYESGTTSYTVTVGVRDRLNEHGTIDTVTDDELDVTITVTNQDEPGAVTFTNPTPQARIELTASLGDPDVVAENSTTWQWSISNTSGNGFASIDAATDASYTPSDDDIGKYLRATAAYTDGHGANKTAQGEPGNAVRVAHNPNQPPTFTEDPNNNPITFSIAENTPAGQDIGTPVTATDPDRTDTIAYSLGTPSASVFHIVSDTGQIQTEGSLDHETKATYTVTVTATDPSNESDTIAVTINVTDEDEPPSKPDAPTVTAKANTHDTLTVTWTAPTNTGPDLTSYTFAHRKHDVQEWTTQTIQVTSFADPANPTLDITGLLPETQYFARVQADNDEGTGEWSGEGSGTTDIKPEADWFELTVNYEEATYTVTEGSAVTITVELSKDGTAEAADRKLAVPITVTPGTAETGDYTVNGLTSGALAFVPGETSQTFTVVANQDSDRSNETLTLGFGTLPTKVTAGSSATTLMTINDNDRRSSVRPPVNQRPVFNPGTVETISVPEDTVPSTDIGDPITAVDGDANDTLTYSLDAASATVFTIVADTGQLQTKAVLNYKVKNSYTVTVTATDSSGATATTDVTINVTDVEEPPGKPDAPTVGPASTNGHNTLSVSWNAPYNTGPAITSYTVEYRKHDSTRWTADNLTITGTTATITSLLPDTRYAATVRATNDEGTGEWSNEGYGSTEAIPISEHLDLTVNYQAAAYTVTEGSTVTVTVTLSAAADRALVIPITITADSAESGDYTAGGFDGGNALAFASGENSKAFTITANSDADTDDETLDLGFGTLPDKVTAGTTSVATVTINDQIVTLPQRTVSYGAASYTVNEGSSATIDVTLSQAADRALSVPITVTRGTAEARDYEVSGLTGGGVAFSQGANSGSFTITAAQDEDSSNETLSLGFGTMPGGVSAGSPATASVTIDDDDPPVVYNPPPRRRSGGSSRRRGSGGWVMGSENYPPVFMEGPTASREVPEIARKSANIGYPVTATDPNLDKLTYALTGDDRDSFDIGPDTGQLLTKAPLDFETRPGYAVGVTVSDGRGGSDSIEVSIGLTDVQEILFDRDTQTVARVTPGAGATIVTPDGSGTVALPAGSRDSDYYVRIGSGANACARDAPPGDLYVYTTVEIFDLQGNLEEDVTLDQPAVILLRLDAGKLGGVADALAIHEAGGIRVYRRASPQEDWAEVDFTLVSDDEGGITVFVTGVLQFGCFVAVADTSVLPPAAPAADPTPEPTPQPVAVPVVDDVPPAPPAAATGPKAEPVYPPVSRPLLTTPLSIDGAAPLSIFGAVEKFARDIPLWVLMMLLIASAAWSVGVYAYDVWRRNHPPPPKWRSEVAEIGRDVLVPTG